MGYAARQTRQLVASGSRSFSTSIASFARTLPRPIATRPASQKNTSIPADMYQLTKRYPRHPLLAFFNQSERTIKLVGEKTQTKDVMIPAALRTQDITKDVFSRSWLAPELRTKSSLQLHQLWYKCLMERNVVHTTLAELQRTGTTTLAEFNNFNGYKIDRRVRKTMARIKYVLNERRLALLKAQEQEQAEVGMPFTTFKQREARRVTIDLLEEEPDALVEVADPPKAV